MSEKPKELTRRYFLTAGETDAQGMMPMWLIIARAIEIATEHANILGIGYAALKELGIGWVLTRMSVEMLRYPVINEEYTVTTWIEGYNRLYSDRCFVMCDGAGNVVGHMRSMWVAIDMEKRTAADLTELERDSFPLGMRECPVPVQRKMAKMDVCNREVEYKFRFTDIDFNRHVNTVQYVKHILNQWSMDFFDHHCIHKFEIAFHHECYYGETVTIRIADIDEKVSHCEIVRDGARAIAAIVEFDNRKQPTE